MSDGGAGPRTELARDLSLFDITMIGVGAMIGAGIFVLTGMAAGQAGPALVTAFALNGFITIFTGMVYAELGSAIPEAGGGYLWVRQALGRSQAFIAGWMSWFAHAVAGSLYTLGFGAFATLLLVEHLELVPFGLSMSVLEKAFAVLAGGSFAYINFRGAKETGLAGNIVTLVKVTVILVFVVAGLAAIFGEPARAAEKFQPFMPRGFGGVFIAMGLTFIAFEGYEIIVQSGEEVVNPRENVPKAVFYSMLAVVTVYILVGGVLIGAVDPTPELVEAARAGGASGMHGPGLGDLPSEPAIWQVLGHLGELGLARAADQVLPFGTLVILAAGLFSTLSALNATTYSSTRVGFAMGRDHVLPDAFASVHSERRTPHVSVAASGALIVFMAVALPIEHVAAATDVMFLLLFLQVNYAAIVIRRRHGEELDYGYLMPWFPWIPIAGIVTKLFLAVYLFNYSPLAWYGALGWIALGSGVFFTYSRRRIRETETREELRLVSEERAPTEREYQVLVPLAHPDHAPRLVRLAGAIARRYEGEVQLVTVVTVPDQTPLSAGYRYVEGKRELLEGAMERLPEGVPGHFTVTIGHDVGHSIVIMARERDSEVIVLGWRGRKKRRVADLVLGSVIDRVVQGAPCDVCVVKLGEEEPPARLLVPVAGGPHSELAVRVAAAIRAHEGVRLTLLRVAEPGGAEQAAEELAELAESVRQEEGLRVETAVQEGRDVASAILRRAREEDADTIVLGATEEGWVRQIVFGAVPERVGEAFEGQVLMVRAHRPIKSALRSTLRRWLPITRRARAGGSDRVEEIAP